MNVKRILMLVDLVLYVPILLVVYNVSVHKVLKVIHIPKAVTMLTNAQDHHVEEMRCVPIWKDRSGVLVQKDLRAIQCTLVKVRNYRYFKIIVN